MQHVSTPPALTCDPVRLVEEFPRWLEKVSAKSPGGVILVLDSVDRFLVSFVCGMLTIVVYVVCFLLKYIEVKTTWVKDATFWIIVFAVWCFIVYLGKNIFKEEQYKFYDCYLSVCLVTLWGGVWFMVT